VPRKEVHIDTRWLLAGSGYGVDSLQKEDPMSTSERERERLCRSQTDKEDSMITRGRERQKLSRREFLKSSALATAGIAVAACAKKPTEAPAPTKEEAPTKAAATATPEPAGASARQAPAFQEKVKAGELPALEERISQEPRAIEPLHKIGKYGGDYVQGILNPRDYPLGRVVVYEPLMRWDPDWTEIIPSVATSFEVQDDAKTYVFNLRKGMKWSDGEPFTADDVVFWREEYEEKDLWPNFPTTYSTKSGPVDVGKVDDYTVKFSFQDPSGLFPMIVAQKFDGMMYKPAHFNRQFIPAHADKAALDAKIKEAGVSNWYEGYPTWTDGTQTAGVPVIWAWMITPYDAASNQIIFEQNPYYWCQDSEGNQLPYLDRFVSKIAQDREAIIMMCVAGEISYQYHHVSELKNKPMYVQNAEKGDFHTVECIYPGMGDAILNMNLTHKDPVKRQLFQNKRFRIGVSYALNRQETVDIANQGVGTPWQPSPLPESSYYDEEMSTQYLEYDPEKANEILDEVIPDRDADGFRLGPDGKQLTILCEIDSDRQSHIDTCELVKKYMADVGIRWENKVQDKTLNWAKMPENELEVWPFYGDAGLDFDILGSPKNYFAVGQNSFFAPLWGAWYSSGGTEGEEPPEAMQKQMALYAELQASGDPEFQHEKMEEILNIAKEEFWTVGTWRGGLFIAICKNKFRNVPDKHWVTWPYPDPGPFNPCTFFWDT
jgi:peptide/nickel transport system substrate-binding protein